MTRPAPTLAVGTELPPLVLPAITHDTLHAYADASGDHAAVHLDTDNARSMGFDDVIAHGLLVMAFLGRAVTDYVTQRKLLSFSSRFTTVVNLGDRLTCGGRVVEVKETGQGQRVAVLDLTVDNQDGENKIKGRATVAL